MQVYLLGILQRFPIFDPERVGSATKRFLCTRAGEVFIFHAPLPPLQELQVCTHNASRRKELTGYKPSAWFS